MISIMEVGCDVVRVILILQDEWYDTVDPVQYFGVTLLSSVGAARGRSSSIYLTPNLVVRRDWLIV